MQIEMGIERACLLRACTWGDVDWGTLDRLLQLRSKIELALEEQTPDDLGLSLLDGGGYIVARGANPTTCMLTIDLGAQELTDLAKGGSARQRWGLETASRALAEHIRHLPHWLVEMQNEAVNVELVQRLPEERRRELLSKEA